MFHLQSFFANLGAAASNTTLAAVSDEVFSDRNSAFIYTEPYAIAALFYKAPGATRVRSNLPTFNGWGRHHVFPVNRSATVPSPYAIQDLRKEPIPITLNEPLTWEGSNDAAGAEDSVLHQLIIPPDWSMELPAHEKRITVRCTGAVTGVANSWSALGALTFPDQDLRGGTYAVIGAECQDAGVTAFRFFFPRARLTQGRILRPGGIALEALNNLPHPMFNGGLGEWGRFHTFELPRVQIFANAAGASVQELRLHLLYLGAEESLLFQ